MKIRWYIHDAHCLTVESGGGQTAPSIEWRSGALRRVSAGWDRTPERHTIELWLRGALPENGNLDTFESHALRTIAGRGFEIGTGTIHDWAWGNAHWEYPGALRLEREEDAGRTRDPDGYTRVNQSEIGERLRRAADEADRVRAARARGQPHRKSALSGARGKITLHIDEHGHMLVPTGQSLSTWIVKVENRPDWPGEAGVESVCQRALIHLGLEAAETTAQIIDGSPVVMSKRSDRVLQEDAVVATHQEDWLQAYGRGPGFKDDEHGPDLGFRSLYAIMRRYGDEIATLQTTRLLAAACAMCNGDLHRKNIALAHGAPDEPFRIRLAPAYDFSSQCGVDRTGDNLTIAIAGMTRAWEVDETRWRRLAEECRLDPEETIGTAKETAVRAPDALSAAREEAKRDDEWRNPEVVEQRIESTIKAARKYAEIISTKSERGRARGGLELAKTATPSTVAESAGGDDAGEERAMRIHNMRLRHPDAAVRTKAALDISAMEPNETAARRLTKLLTEDRAVAQDAALAAMVQKRIADRESEPEGSGGEKTRRDDAIARATQESARREARESTQWKPKAASGTGRRKHMSSKKSEQDATERR